MHKQVLLKLIKFKSKTEVFKWFENEESNMDHIVNLFFEYYRPMTITLIRRMAKTGIVYQNVVDFVIPDRNHLHLNYLHYHVYYHLHCHLHLNRLLVLCYY